MPIPVEFGSADQGVTVGAVTIPLGLFEFPSNTIGLINVQVIAVRTDGASRAWTTSGLLKKVGGTLAIMEAIPVPPNTFDSAADALALGAGVTIGLFSDAVFVGVNCTGQAGQQIDWLVRISGNGMTQ
jgi:hypothetical protein